MENDDLFQEEPFDEDIEATLAVFSHNPSFICDIIRASDLLHLRYHFYNFTPKSKYFLKEDNDSLPTFVCIQTPSQHIAEELESNIHEVTGHEHFAANRKRSFLSGSSWLAFEITAESIPFTEHDLLDWEKYFRLITIDDFVKFNSDHSTFEIDNSPLWKILESLELDYLEDMEMVGVIGQLINDYSNLNLTDLKYNSTREELEKAASAYQGKNTPKFISFNNGILPLTKLEVPYKMYLSPLAASAKGNNRFQGRHVFQNQNQLRIEYADKSLGIDITKPWENQLWFIDKSSNFHLPRFKVVYADPYKEKGSNANAELLPSALHRHELNYLTMQGSPERDVVTDYFKISSLGASTKLKYRNDNPVANVFNNPFQFSTVGWEQEIKNARDIKTVITFRAVDVFTGLKLLVSTVAQRRYKFGVSYLEKRYFVTYAEEYKEYVDPLVVSRIPFTRVTPVSNGSYFSPLSPEQIGCRNSYLICKEGVTEFSEQAPLNFSYIGLDKEGKEHPLDLKLILIPAEKYEITSGVFQPRKDKPEEKYEPGGLTAVKFMDFGFLNPSRDEQFISNPAEPDALEAEEDRYRYRVISNFKPSNREALKNMDLIPLRSHVHTYSNLYQIKIDSTLSYAKIKRLRGGVIAKNSYAATFQTENLILFSEINEQTTEEKDPFLLDFVVIPKLEEADVVISQIDQIEAKSSFRKINYSKAYFQSNQNLDEVQENNRVKLLFRLVNYNDTSESYETAPIKNLFSSNYKNAGALVNPGIPISHISILDQGICFNESHNQNQPQQEILTSVYLKHDFLIKTSSVFQEFDAEILGIKLLDILDEFLEVKELPVFRNIQSSSITPEALDQLLEPYKGLMDAGQQTYEKYLDEYRKATTELKKLEAQYRKYINTKPKEWLEKLLEAYQNSENFKRHHEFIIEKTSEYRTTYLTPLKAKLAKVIDMTDLASKVNSLFNHTELEEQALKVKMHAIFNFQKQLTIPNLSENEGQKVFKTAVRCIIVEKLLLEEEFRLIEFSKALAKINYEEQYNHCNHLILQTIQEALIFSKHFVISESSRIQIFLDDYLNAHQKGTENYIDSQVQYLLKINQLFNHHNIESVLVPIMHLGHWYDNLQRHYRNLKDQFPPSSELEIKLSDDLCRQIFTKASKNLESLEIQEDVHLRSMEGFQNIRKRFKNIKDAYKKNLKKILAQNTIDSEKTLNILISSVEDDNRRIEIRKEVTILKDDFHQLIAKLDQVYKNFNDELATAKKIARDLEEKIRNFIPNKIDKTKVLLEKKLKENSNTDEVRKIKSLLNRLETLSSQKLNYNFSTKKFRKVAIGGNYIKFIPNNTELSVDVNYELELNPINDHPDGVVKRDYWTTSELTNFKLSFLDIIGVNFRKVSFTNGANVKDSFDVVLGNVEFDGPLNFIEAFQEYLNSLNNNLVFAITSSYVKTSYSVAFPNFSAGYFNFFNFNLFAQLLLPFQPDKSLQLQFGLGSEMNKFGITVSGIFGGQGYFNIIVEPKKGIVGLVLVMEFGAIYHFNFGAAVGSAYLVGGIYIERKHSNFKLKAYLLCVGRFRIIGLFSASMSFYLGLESNGKDLKGSCSIKVSKRFSIFFKVTVTCTMERTLKHAKKSGNRQKEININFKRFKTNAADNIKVYDSNLHRKNFCTDEGIHMMLESTELDEKLLFRNSFKARLLKSGKLVSEEKVAHLFHKDKPSNYFQLDMDLAKISESGYYDFQLVNDDSVVYEQRDLKIIDIQEEYVDGLWPGDPKKKEYYKSYYSL